MSRINRKFWTPKDLGIKETGNLIDVFDNHIKSVYRINDQEFDYLCEVFDDSQIELFVTDNPTYAQKRALITLLNLYIKYD